MTISRCQDCIFHTPDHRGNFQTCSGIYPADKEHECQSFEKGKDQPQQDGGLT